MQESNRSGSSASRTKFNKLKDRKIDIQLMPIDIPHSSIIFRVDIEEYKSKDYSIDTMVSHALQSSKRALIFAFDITNIDSYNKFTKPAITQYLQECGERNQENYYIPPFIIMGLRADYPEEREVPEAEV